MQNFWYFVLAVDSRLEAHLKFSDYLWRGHLILAYVPLAKITQNWIVDQSTACDFMACAYEKVFSNILLLKLQGKITGCQLGKIRCQIWDRDDHGILLPKLFWSTVRKFCSSDQEKLLKAEKMKKCLRSLEQFI